MKKIFFPSCKVSSTYKASSDKLNKYIKDKMDIDPIGCCRVNHKQLTNKDTAIVVCNNCAAILRESSDVGDIKFVWEIINEDKDFKFPNYHGETITIRDCWIAVEKRNVQDAIRSLLSKMNINYVEMDDNFEKTRYCGAYLLSPCSEANYSLAPKRYLEYGKDVFTSCTEDEKINKLKDYCKNIKTDKVVCYCKSCTEGIKTGGKEGIHLIQLLFPV